MTPAAQDRAVERRYVWDLPTRLFKWSLVAAGATAFVLGETMRFDTVGRHEAAGYVVGGLIAFRLVWGFLGAPASRFSTLARDLTRLPDYALRLLRPEPSHWIGHNPMGALWLVAFLVSAIVQVVSGLFAYSDSFFDGGPLSGLVDEATRNVANAIHATNAGVLLALVALHVSAVFFYAIWKRENLIGAMISGWKDVRGRD